jgi:hypothetical protein
MTELPFSALPPTPTEGRSKGRPFASAGLRRAAAVTTVQAYRMRMRALAKLSPLEVWHSRMELAREINQIDDQELRRRLHAIIILSPL